MPSTTLQPFCRTIKSPFVTVTYGSRLTNEQPDTVTLDLFEGRSDTRIVRSYFCEFFPYQIIVSEKRNSSMIPVPQCERTC